MIRSSFGISSIAFAPSFLFFLLYTPMLVSIAWLIAALLLRSPVEALSEDIAITNLIIIITNILKINESKGEEGSEFLRPISCSSCNLDDGNQRALTTPELGCLAATFHWGWVGEIGHLLLGKHGLLRVDALLQQEQMRALQHMHLGSEVLQWFMRLELRMYDQLLSRI